MKSWQGSASRRPLFGCLVALCFWVADPVYAMDASDAERATFHELVRMAEKIASQAAQMQAMAPDNGSAQRMATDVRDLRVAVERLAAGSRAADVFPPQPNVSSR